jgi:hypothetical protein
LRHRDPGHCLVAHSRAPQQPIQAVETINPDTLPHGPLSELKFNDMSFVFTDAN